MIRDISFILFIGLTFGSHFLPAQTNTNVQAQQTLDEEKVLISY